MGLFTRTPPTAAADVSVLTAAASVVRFNDKDAVKSTLAKHATWEDEAWAYYDEVPEVHFGVNYSGNALTKVTFYAACVDAVGAIVPVNSETSPLMGTPVAIQADAEMSRLHAEMGGQGELNRLAEINLEVPGQFYLDGRGERIDPITQQVISVESWDIIATDCVVQSQDVDEFERPIVYYRDEPNDPKNKWAKIDPDQDTLIHAYMRHPRYKKRADSYMRALLTDCQTIVALNNQVLAESRSRMNAGLLVVPKEIQFEQSKNPKDPNQFMADLVEALVTPIEDPSDQRSLVPPIIRGQKENLTPDVLRRIDLSRTTDDSVDGRILQRIDRIARGLNVPVEVVMGHMSTTFANAEQIDQDTFDDHLEPKCRTIAEIYGYAFLRPQLYEAMNQQTSQQLIAEELGLEPPPTRSIGSEQIEQIFVWFDASALVRTKDPEDIPETALEAGAISIAAYRKRRNIQESEAPNEQELAMQIAMKKGIFGAELTALMLYLGGVEIPPEFLKPAGAEDAPGAAPPAAAPAAIETNGSALVAALIEAQAAAASPGSTPPDPFEPSNLGRSLLAVDLDLRSRIHGAAEAAMERALERAGARLKGRAQVRAVVASTPAPQIAAKLGPAFVASVGYDVKSLLDGAWAVLERQFKEWCLSASVEAMTLIEQATVPFTAQQRDDHRALSRLAVDAGWSFFQTELDVIAAARLYDPEGDGDIAIYGRIPTGVVREALTIAGGDSGVFTLLAAGTPTKPAGGIATGKLSNDVAEQQGISTPSYRWVYGPAHREHPFNPHRQLNGVTFEKFTDTKLVNNASWPPGAYFYPGDHVGCSCDVEPIMVFTPPQTATAETASVLTLGKIPKSTQQTAPADTVVSMKVARESVKAVRMKVGDVIARPDFGRDGDALLTPKKTLEQRINAGDTLTIIHVEQFKYGGTANAVRVTTADGQVTVFSGRANVLRLAAEG